MDRINLTDKFSLFAEHWRPRIAGAFNGQEIKLVKFQGEFVWHHHDETDEVFFVWKGKFRMEYRDRSVELKAGELVIVPRGVEHRPVAEEEVEVILFEAAQTRNTGNVIDAELTADAYEPL